MLKRLYVTVIAIVIESILVKMICNSYINNVDSDGVLTDKLFNVHSVVTLITLVCYFGLVTMWGTYLIKRWKKSLRMD